MRIATANFYVGNTRVAEDAKALAALKPDVVGIQEGHSGNVAKIKATISQQYRVLVGGNSIEAQDTPVAVSRNHKVLKWWTRRISKRSQKENIGMPRTATEVRIKDEDAKTWAVINTHTNAAVQNRETKQPLPKTIRRVAEFIAGMIVLEAMIRRAKKECNYVVLTGDLNYRVVKTGIWKFSPQALFARTKMDFVVEGLDYIAFSRNLRVKNKRVIPPVKGGHDHPWILVDLDPKK